MSIKTGKFIPPGQQHLDLIYSYSKGAFVIEVPAVTFTDYEGKHFGNAKGQITCTLAEGLELRLSQLNFDQLEVGRLHAGGGLGSHTTSSLKLTATGTTESGLAFETTGLDLRSFGIGVDLILSPDSIRFVSNGETGGYYRLVMTTSRRHFLPMNVDHRSNTADEIRRNIPYSYGKIELDDATFELKGRDHREYLCTSSQQKTPERQVALEDALLLSMSFADGKKKKKLATFEMGEKYVTTLLRATTESGRTFLSPLTYLNDSSGYELVSDLTRFLATAENQAVATLLEVFILSPRPLEIGSRLSIICTLIEGLINELITAKHLTLADNVAFEEARKTIRKALESLLPREIVGRWAAALKAVPKHTLRDRVLFVAKELGVVVEDTGDRYLSIRNRFAHGDYSHPYEQSEEIAQGAWDDLGYVTNLFNKFLMRAADYRGNYTDFAVAGSQLSNMGEQADRVFNSGNSGANSTTSTRRSTE
jgi:hypothetical protein